MPTPRVRNSQLRMLALWPGLFIQPRITAAASPWPRAMFSPPIPDMPALVARSHGVLPSGSVWSKKPRTAMSLLNAPASPASGGFARTGPQPACARSWFTRVSTAVSSAEWPAEVGGTAGAAGAEVFGAEGFGFTGVGVGLACGVFAGSVEGDGEGEGEGLADGDGEAEGVGEEEEGRVLAPAEARPERLARPPCCSSALSGLGEAWASASAVFASEPAAVTPT